MVECFKNRTISSFGRPKGGSAAGHAVRCAAVAWVCLLLGGCASQGYPGGGPKDVTPPAVTLATPANGSTAFAAKEFYIEFDEYVTVKEAESNVIVSPPLRHKPQYATKGRGVLVKLKDTLAANTTYLFQFKNAIADYNEGNLLPSLEYVFSTGHALDSCSLGGQVRDAFGGEPWKETVTVVLYAARTGMPAEEGAAAEATLPAAEGGETALGGVADSAIVCAAPDYVTRCDSTGHFFFHYIRPGTYRLMAYEDADKNLKLGGSEAIAFCDTLVHAAYVPPQAPADSARADSTKADNAQSGSHGARADSLRQAAAYSHLLRISAPAGETQRLSTAGMPRRGYATVPAVLPLRAPRVVSLADSIAWQLNRTGDTLLVWALNEQSDSLHLWVQDATGIDDTLRLRYHAAKSAAAGKPAGKSKRDDGGQRPFLAFSAAGTMPYFDTLRVSFRNPIQAVQDEGTAYIYNVSDSVQQPCRFLLDTTRLQALVADSSGQPFPFVQGKRYRCLLLPHFFTDLYGHDNDSAVCSFEVSSADRYGQLSVQVDAARWQQPAGASAADTLQFILQLLDDKGKVLTQRVLAQPQQVVFPHLLPGNYRVRAIEDADGNARWDAGDYWRRRQPERTFLFGKTIVMRANWEFNESWTIEN